MKILVFFTFGISFKDWVRVGHVTRELSYYKKLTEAGHQITMLTYGDESDLNYKHLAGEISIIPAYKYTKAPANKFLRVCHSLILAFKLKDVFLDADCFKTNQMYGSWVPVIGKILYGKPLLVRCGNEWLLNTLRDKKNGPIKILKCIFGYFLELIAYSYANQIIISCESGREFIHKMFPVKKRKIQLFRNFINTSLFSPENKELSKEIYNKRVLYIGRLAIEKNLDNLIKGFSRTYYELDIIGVGKDKDALMSLAEEEEAKVRFLGVYHNDELPKIINRYPVFVLPSLYENNPKVLLEAMSCGTAVIGTNVEGIKEIILHNKNGLLCKTDSGSIRKAIGTLMKNKSLRERLSQEARGFIEQNCSIDKIVKYECDIYKSLALN